jgi:hypothetical protein
MGQSEGSIRYCRTLAKGLSYLLHSDFTAAQEMLGFIAMLSGLVCSSFRRLAHLGFQWFASTHGFLKWQLSIARFLEQLLCPILLPGYATVAGFSLEEMFRAENGIRTMDGKVIFFIL